MRWSGSKKSLFARFTPVVAFCCSCEKADLSVPTPFFFTSSALGRDLSAFSTLLTAEQYAGLLLLPHPASSAPPINSASSATPAVGGSNDCHVVRIRGS